MSNEFTADELRQELERRRQGGISVSEPSIVDRYLGGFLKNVEATGAGMYGSVANPISGVQGLVSNSTPVNEQMGVDENRYKNNTTAYRFGEGALPGAIGGFFAGGPVGAVAGGLVGGLTNVGAKQIFPGDSITSIIGQTAVGMLPGSVGALSRNFRGRTPDTPKASVDPDTGTLVSPGQRSGDTGMLLQEERLRRDARTVNTVNNFDKAQQATIDEFASSLQNLRTQLSPEALRDTLRNRYEAFNTETLNNFKRSNNQAFSAATSIRGDVIPTNNVHAAVDDLIRQYSNTEIPGNTQILNNLLRIRQNLSQMTGNMIVGPNGNPMVQTQGANISVERLKQSLSAWGETAYKGQYNSGGVTAFDDVDPGVAKGVARRVLNAYRADLDAAINNNIPGAELLRNARDQYATGLRHLENVANQPVNKYVTSAKMDKAPEKILEDIVKMRPSERVEMATVLGRDYPSVYDTVRSKALTDILEKYRSGDGFDLRAFFKDQPLGGDNAWMFASRAEQNRVSSLMQVLEQVNRKSKATDLTPQELQAAYRAASESAGVVGGAFAKYGVQAVTDTFRALAFKGSNDPKKLAYMFFTPNGRQLIQELAKPNPNPKYLTREALDGLMVGSASAVSQVRNTVPKPEEKVDFTPEELEQEMIRRGLR